MTDHKMTDEEFYRKCAIAEGYEFRTHSPDWKKWWCLSVGDGHGWFKRPGSEDWGCIPCMWDNPYKTTDDLMRVCRALGWRAAVYNGVVMSTAWLYKDSGELVEESSHLPYDALKSAMMQAWSQPTEGEG